MVLELAMLTVRTGQAQAFEAAFADASAIISAMPGYVGHSLQRCLEQADRYALLVNWQTLEDHTIGFRESSEYPRWKALLHGFYDPFPTVEHFIDVPLHHAKPLFVHP